MYRINLVADVGPDSARKGSTGPTFPIADTLVAAAPATAGVSVGLDGKPGPAALGVDSENPGGAPGLTGAPGAVARRAMRDHSYLHFRSSRDQSIGHWPAVICGEPLCADRRACLL